MEFKVNNITWKIVELSQKEIKEELSRRNSEGLEDKPCDNGRYFGLTFLDVQTIYLDKDLSLERKRLSLIHELTHCYVNSFITHLSQTYDEELVCDICSNSHDFIKGVIDEYFK